MSKKRAYIRKRRSVHLRCRQKAENARKVRSRQKPVQSPESASVTFQAAATLWHRTNVARYKGATAVKYENLLRSHILPELGARQLEEINTLLLADFMNAKLHCGRLDHSGGLSSSYVRSMMLLVLDIMEFAAAEGLCPPVKTTLQTPAANRQEVVILDTDALRRLETYLLAKPDITGTGILISLHTGLRISEVCALRWEDIDFRKAVLHVRSTVARVRGTDGGTATRLIIDTPKTKSSLRDIPLSRQLMAVLLPLYEKRRSEYVISDKSGFVSPRTYEYRFHRVLDRCGLPSINYHALRHPYVKHTTKIFSLRLMNFQAQAYPDARRKTRGACQLLRVGQSRSPVRPLCNRKQFSCSPPQSKISRILYAISMRLSGYTSTRSISSSASSVVSVSASKIALDASMRLSCRACSSCFCFACANTAA